MNKRTPLYKTHISEGAKMVPFAGFDMPIEYSGVVSEVSAVRTGGGIFDVSHMGRVEFKGKDAQKLLDFVLSCDVSKLGIQSAKYNLICNTQGGVIDDCIVYRVNEYDYLLIINAARHSVDMDWINTKMVELGKLDLSIKDITEDTVLIAVQGKNAVDTVAKIADEDDELVKSTKRFGTKQITIKGANCLIARTGYTGEDGFEIVASANDGEKVWKSLREQNFLPCGLASRDVLRLEAGLVLYGNDIDLKNNPYECGLGWTVKLNKEADYAPREALSSLSSTKKRLLAVEVKGAIPRRKMDVLEPKTKSVVGVVTSGTYSPTIKRGISLVMFDEPHEVGTEVCIDLRGRPVFGTVVSLPFYS